MNFMLHFALARSETGSDSAAVGAMLPDLWRMAARAARARRGLVVADAPAPLADVLRGIEHHFDADAWFHRLPAFDLHEHATRDALVRADGGRSPRLGLFAHVAWEMALDGALVRREQSRIEIDVRRAIGEADAATRAAAELHHADARARAGAAAARYEERITRILGAVASFDLPGGYATPGGLAARLAGVRASFGMLASPDDVARWAIAFDELAPAMDRALEELLELRRRSEAAPR
jgi:hypothetical protein